MPVGEGEEGIGVGEVREGVFIFHGKVWFRDCRPVLIKLGPVMRMIYVFFDLSSGGLI